MAKIALKLMDFGMDYQYENNGSNGEKIVSFELGLEISNQQGKIYYSCTSVPEVFKESDTMYSYLAELVEKECINETT
ncbi:MAG: hypothetical protein ACSHXA_07430 [Polaribacter sp.]|uniref:hypothetical protein n=1 Tax=Polaribacter sp. TaxID=1920175 RepID=UPI003EF2ABFA